MNLGLQVFVLLPGSLVFSRNTQKDFISDRFFELLCIHLFKIFYVDQQLSKGHLRLCYSLVLHPSMQHKQ
jgi:hypothetical protein